MLTRTIYKKLKNSNIICFDVDSTILANEGIDELAKYLNRDNQISNITNKAMKGSITFEDSLESRLNIIKPSINDIHSYLKNNPPILTKNVDNFIKKLQNDNKIIYLVSGGFEPLILPCAKVLNIPYTNVIANKFIHSPQTGEYLSFDKTSFTSKSGGKKNALQYIKEKHFKNENCSMIMIGDGITDLEAKPPADFFIGFGGVTEREIVKEKSDYYITNFQELIDIYE